jgi:hypothetical protein
MTELRLLDGKRFLAVLEISVAPSKSKATFFQG